MENRLIQRQIPVTGLLNRDHQGAGYSRRRGGGQEGHSRRSGTAVTWHRSAAEFQALRPPGVSPARLAPGAPWASRPRHPGASPAHLGHIVLHLVQVSVFQGPHELLVAHRCSGWAGRPGRRGGYARRGDTRNRRASGRREGEAAGRNDRWGGRKFFCSRWAQPNRFRLAGGEAGRLHFRFTPR